MKKNSFRHITITIQPRAKGLTNMFALTSKLVFRTFPLENMGGALPTLSSSSPSLRPYFFSLSNFAPCSTI